MTSWILGATLAMAGPTVSQEVITDGPVRKRVVSDSADLVLYYGGEQHGALGPCGCDGRPKGSLARAATYLVASQKASPDVPVMVLNTGGWTDPRTTLYGRPDPAAHVANLKMVEGFNLGGWDVLNVGWRDLPWLLANGFPNGVVSANITSADKPGPPAFVVRDGVAVIGLTGAGPSYRADPRVRDPMDALRATLPLAMAQAEVIVVLAYELGAATDEVAALSGVDVVIEAGAFEHSYPPWSDADTVWVRSRYETQRLGELRMSITDGAVVTALDRQVDLDSKVPSDGALRKLERQTH